MARAHGLARNWFGWALGALAALTLVLATPVHMLDFDEAAGPVAELAVHGSAAAHALIDHGQPGHACSGHCAAHVMAEATAPVIVAAPSPGHLIFVAAENRPGHARPPSQPDRPPKA
jgi:hypothetical protein